MKGTGNDKTEVNIKMKSKLRKCQFWKFPWETILVEEKIVDF